MDERSMDERSGRSTNLKRRVEMGLRLGQELHLLSRRPLLVYSCIRDYPQGLQL